jgi:carboxylesterase
MAGAEPIDLRGGPVGALLCHGFTGTTQSMRPWAEHLHAAGLTVSAPRLPGHGTRWQDLNRTRWADWYGELQTAFDDLRARCGTVFVLGLSMGGTLGLRLAELRGEQVAGLVVVNAPLATERKDARLLPLAQRFIPAFPGVANDIKKPGGQELAYTKLPLKAAYSLSQAWPVVLGDLDQVRCPVLVYRSAVDHVVEPVSARLLVAGLQTAGATVESRVLDNSFHVATLDHDAERLFAESLEFVRTHTPAAAG